MTAPAEPLSVPGRPKLDPRFAFHAEPGGVVLLSEAGYFWLEGAPYGPLLAALDGRRTLGEAVEHSRLPPAEAFAAVTLLAGEGLLVTGDAEPLPPRLSTAALEAAVAAVFGEPRPRVRRAARGARRPARLGAVQVAVDGPGSPDLDRLPDDSDLLLVMTGDYLAPELAALATQLSEAGRPWLPLRPFGHRPWIGPLISPSAACWRCLRERLQGNLSLERCLGLRPPRPASEASVRWAQELAAERAGAYLASGESALTEHLLEVDLAACELTLHPVPPRPCCRDRPARHGTGHEPGAALDLVSRPRLPGAAGGHRTAGAEATLARLATALSPVTGLAHSLRRRPLASGDLEVYTAAHAYPGRCVAWPRLERRLQSRCAGKGRTPAQAKVSAVAEALERHAGFHRPHDSHVHASFRQLGEDAIHPNTCMLFSDAQYRDRERLNARHDHGNWIPRPFDEEQPVDWTLVWSLGERRSRYLPTAYCFFDPRPSPSPYCRADSNGNAAGNHLEEAVLQGFLEVVERDAVALWWYSRARRPEMPGSGDDPLVADLRAGLAATGRDLWLLDLTADLGIPVTVAVSRTVERRADDLLLGFGAHLEAELAIERAVTELAQFLIHDPAGSSRRIIAHRASELDWLEPSPAAAPATGGARHLVHQDLELEIRGCVEAAGRLGLDTLVLRQTRADSPLEVVKVVVPGMRPWWARFAPGRLYRVPVELGWIPGPLDESELNPIQLFL